MSFSAKGAVSLAAWGNAPWIHRNPKKTSAESAIHISAQLEHLRELDSQRKHLTHLAGDGTESRCAGERCLGGEIESQFDQPNQKAD